MTDRAVQRLRNIVIYTRYIYKILIWVITVNIYIYLYIHIYTGRLSFPRYGGYYYVEMIVIFLS